jgi:peptide/nickel transport system permease protein
MIRFIIRRLLLAIPVLLGILFVTFALARLLPGDPCRATLGEHATDAVCDAFMARYGLDQPIPAQFGIYLGDVLQGDLGKSIRFGRPVTDLMLERLPITVELALSALIFSSVFGIILGTVSAYWHNSPLDVVTMVGANLGVSMPIFVLGLMLAYLFAITLKDTPLALPPSGRLSSGMQVVSLAKTWNLEQLNGFPRGVLDFVSNMHIVSGVLTGSWALAGDALKHLILPTIALGTIPMAIIARMTRSSLLDVLSLDYTRTARAKGLKERLVVFRHAFRNALLPVVTVIGLQLGSLLGGAVLTETIFGLSGVGKILYDSITARDYTVVQAFTLVIAVGFVVVNLIVDLSYAYLDPRIRLS